MNALVHVLSQGLRDALLMAWEVSWALVFGFFISAVVQAWVPRARIERALSGRGPRPIATATALGAASSSCSYAAVAIAKSLFEKGASASSALAFEVASTNLVWELGLVLWVLIGWQFTLGEYLGGIVMIALMALLLRVFVSRRLEELARGHARAVDGGHAHHAASTELDWRTRLTSADAWSDVAHNFRGDWRMLWKEMAAGFLLAGFVAQFGNGFLGDVFLKGSPQLVQTLWGALVGPLIAVLSFVCSVGNVPLAAVLWSGGISFAGVMAFIFADLIVLPILAIYRKYYGTAFAVRIATLMFVTMVAAALIVDATFGGAGLIPGGARPTRTDLFNPVSLDYTFALNLAGLAIFVSLFALTVRRGATDPVCGMTVDRRRAVTTRLDGRTFHFCSDHCRRAFEAGGDLRPRDGASGAARHERTGHPRDHAALAAHRRPPGR